MNLIDKIKKYNFEFKHIALLSFILIAFEVIIFFIFKGSLDSFIFQAQGWYQKFSANRVANVTANSLEMLIETVRLDEEVSITERKKVVQKFDILLNQHLMEKDVEEVCLFLLVKDQFIVVDDGEVLFNALILKKSNLPPSTLNHRRAVELLDPIKSEIIRVEKPSTIIDNDQVFHSFIPFVPDGEFAGILYVKNTPNFSAITNEFISNYDIIAFAFSILILFGLFVMYMISSYTLKTKERTQQELYEEKQKLIRERIEHEKEFIFTKRIYHANHKSEKIIGFINRDLSLLTGDEEIRKRIIKYANFVGRIIYDMKWYDPPLHTIRNTIFKTNINELIQFLVENLFTRHSVSSSAFVIKTQLDKEFPVVHVNEYVIWEIIEPLVQNSLTHNYEKKIEITIKTELNKKLNKAYVYITDDGKGINSDLLELGENGIKKIFLENTSSKESVGKNFGYGCFIAYNMAKRSGWALDAENLNCGCRFTLTVN